MVGMGAGSRLRVTVSAVRPAERPRIGRRHVGLLRDAAVALLLCVLALWGCAATRPATAATGDASRGILARPGAEVGLASWYGEPHQGQPTASGEIFDMAGMTAAHRTLPLGTRIRVVNVENGRSVQVRVNDRGPYIAGRIVDLSQAAARALDMVEQGVAWVRVDVIGLP
jgi:rare lipoprotein A (peptidoglycan hydrolase)